MSVSALMVLRLGGDIGQLLPTLSLRDIYLATAVTQTAFLLSLAQHTLGGKFLKAAQCRMGM